MMGTDVLDLASGKSSKKPTLLESTMFFFLERGVGYEEFIRLPLPYVMSMIKTHNYIESEKSKAAKKAKKR